MRFIIFTILLLFSSYFSSAQNFLFEKGQNGFHLGGQAVFSDGSRIFGFSPSYTWRGRMTLSVGAGREDSKYSNVVSYSVKPSLNYLILKQNRGGMPLSLGIGTSYQRNYFKNRDDLKAGVFAIDLGIYRRIYMEKKSSLIPAAYLGWAHTKIDRPYPSSTLEEKAIFGIVQTSILLNKFHITPGVHISKENTSFFVQIGVILPERK